MSRDEKPKRMTPEEIKAEINQEVDGYYGLEYGYSLRVAERIREAFYSGKWRVNPQTRHVCLSVWAWFPDALDYTFFKAALDDVFKDAGYYVYSFSRTHFSVYVEITEKPDPTPPGDIPKQKPRPFDMETK